MNDFNFTTNDLDFAPKPVVFTSTPVTFAAHTVDGVQITIGMKIWLYPANDRRCGSIEEKEVATIVSPTRVRFVESPNSRNRWRWSGPRHVKYYSTKELAEEAKAIDKAEPKWMINGKFRVNSCQGVVRYLAAKTNIISDQINVCKTDNKLLVVWVDFNGRMQKYEIRKGRFYGIKEEDLATVVQAMSKPKEATVETPNASIFETGKEQQHV